MSEDPRPYGQLLSELEATLTGELKPDIRRLIAVVETHKQEAWGPAFAGDVFRMMWDRGLVSERDRGEFQEVLHHELKRFETWREEAWAHLQAGRLDDAEDVGRRLLKAVELFFVNDEYTLYIECPEPLEEQFIRATTVSGQRVIAVAPIRVPALTLMAEIHRARQQFTEALRCLEGAIQRNPVSVLPRLLQLNLLKTLGRLEEVWAQGLELHACCYRNDHFADCYRSLGWCAAERQQWELAMCLLLASLHFRVDPMGLQEMRRIVVGSRQRQLLDAAPSRFADVMDAAGVPRHPHALWQTLAIGLADDLAGKDAAQYRQIAAALGRPLQIGAITDVPEESAPDPYLVSLQGLLTSPPSPPALLGDGLVRGMGRALLAEGAKQELSLAAGTVCGVLPMGDVRGLVLRTPDDRLVVAVSGGLMMFCHLLSKCVARFFPLQTTADTISLDLEWEHIEARLAEPDEAHERFVDIFVQACRGDVYKVPPFAQADDSLHLSQPLRHHAELFEVAWGLAVANATDLPPGQPLKLGPDIEVLHNVADPKSVPHLMVIAVRLVLGLSAKDGAPGFMAVAGMDWYLHARSMLEAIQEQTGQTSGDAARMRLHYFREIRRRLREMEGVNPQQTGFTETLDRVLQALWKKHGEEITRRLR